MEAHKHKHSNLPSDNSRAHRWLADRAKELSYATRRVAQAQGAHGLPQLHALIKLIKSDQPNEAATHPEVARDHIWLVNHTTALSTVLGSGMPAWAAIIEYANEFGNAVAPFHATADASEATERTDSNRNWKDWVNSQLDSGAGGLHKWSKLPTEWRPNTALMADGKVTADPIVLLVSQRKTWTSVWKATETPLKQPIRPATPLPRPHAGSAPPSVGWFR